VVEDLLTTELKVKSCVLTNRNEDALQITGLLLKNKMNAKLIQSNDRFNLFNLLELRFFFNLLDAEESIIYEDVWVQSKRDLQNTFSHSNKLDLCLNLINDFESSHSKRKYTSDFKVFIKESKLEDFYHDFRETIFVSTIHKAKGKEFDNIFLILDNFNSQSDKAKRLLYVAMTRAKMNLRIYQNSLFFNNMVSENMEIKVDNEVYDPPSELAMQLGHEHVRLGYFDFVQHRIKECFSGNTLKFKEDRCANNDGELVLKFSKKFLNTIEEQNRKGYSLHTAKINFIVYWLSDNSQKEILIILPEVHFIK
jgi:ATP-dependent DNA helicase RecQ